MLKHGQHVQSDIVQQPAFATAIWILPMDPAVADHLVAWTARVSVACYLTWAVAAILQTRDSPRRGGISFGFYAAGAACLAIHVVLAFGLIHNWSHADAYAHTAKQTAEVVGLNWGGGIYFNYALLAVWVADVAWGVFGRRGSGGPSRGWTLFVHGFLIFMIINATVVFGPTGWIWTAIGYAVLLICVVLVRRSRQN